MVAVKTLASLALLTCAAANSGRRVRGSMPPQPAHPAPFPHSHPKPLPSLSLSRTVRDLQSAQSIVFNGHVYKSLAQHDPARTQRKSEYNKLYNLDAAWHICSPTPDALHVCATYPWATYALVFSDGSAHATALSPQWSSSSWTPGAPPHAAR